MTEKGLPLPENEDERLSCLYSYEILDTAAEEQFDSLTRLAASICEAEIALISLIDKDRQWFKAKCGLDADETTREISFCQYAILEEQLYEISDAREEEHLKNNPLVTGAPFIRFYAGQPIKSREGFLLGTLCVIGSEPKQLTSNQRAALKELAAQVSSLLELRKKKRELEVLKGEFEKTNQKLEDIAHIAREFLWETDTHGNFTFVSKKAEKILEVPLSRIVGSHFGEFVHPDDAELISSMFAGLVERGGGVRKARFRSKASDGTTVWQETLFQPFYDDKGVLLGSRGATSDITQQLQNAQKISASSSLLKAVAEAQTSFINNESNKNDVFSSLLSSLLSLTESEYGFIGEVLFTEKRKPFLRTHAITDISWNEDTRRFYQENVEQGLEFFNLDTLFGNVMVTGSPVISNDPSTDRRAGGLPPNHPDLNAFLGLPFYSGERLIGMVGIANRPGGYDEDVAEYLEPFLSTCANLIEATRVEQGRAQLEKELDSFFSVSVDMLCILGYDGYFRRINPTWEKTLNISADELFSSPLLHFVHKDDREGTLEAFKEVREGGSITFFENRVRCADGSYRWLRWAANGGVDEELIYATAHDITLMKHVEDQLKEARLRAERANEAKSSFLANMSHEIRTPLTSIVGFAESLIQDKLSENDTEEGLQIILKNSSHLLQVINDILDFSKIEAGKLSIEELVCAPSSLLEDLSSLMSLRSSEKGLVFEINVEGSLPGHVVTDPTRVKQILINLVGNAIKFTERGTVSVTASYDPGSEELHFSVKDTGIGMTKEQQEGLFQKFAQADVSTTRLYGGTGLGLAISKQLAQLLGGDMVVASKAGKGSTFSFRVRAPLPNEEVLREHETKKVSALNGADLKLDGKRILIAEDTLVNQKLISRVLKSVGAEYQIVENGKLALEALERSEFDLILMDMQMPVMDGLEAANAIREAGLTLPILALTANTQKDDIERCFEAGCNAYLSKPFRRGEFLAQLQAFFTPSEP